MCTRSWLQRGASDFSLEAGVRMLVNMGRAAWMLEMLLLALPAPSLCGYLYSRVRTEAGKLAVLGKCWYTFRGRNGAAGDSFFFP